MHYCIRGNTRHVKKETKIIDKLASFFISSEQSSLSTELEQLTVNQGVEIATAERHHLYRIDRFLLVR